MEIVLVTATGAAPGPAQLLILFKRRGGVGWLPA